MLGRASPARAFRRADYESSGDLAAACRRFVRAPLAPPESGPHKAPPATKQDTRIGRPGNISCPLGLSRIDALLDWQSRVYPPNAMRLRAWATPFLVTLVAALPTLVSLCELRCLSPGAAEEMASEAAASPACSGHGTEEAEEAPASSPFESAHDCGGHALLAKSGSVGFEVQPPRTFAGLAVVSGSPDHVREPFSHAGALSVSTDLSPPFGRRPGVLRL